MSSHIIQQRLAQYQCQTTMDEENAIKEITQEITLMALSRTDFFWMLQALENKIKTIDWQQAAEDVKRFLKPEVQISLRVWSQSYFLSLLAQVY